MAKQRAEKMHYGVPVICDLPFQIKEVLRSNVRVPSVRSWNMICAAAHGGCKPIPACRSRTEAGRLNRGRN